MQEIDSQPACGLDKPPFRGCVVAGSLNLAFLLHQCYLNAGVDGEQENMSTPFLIPSIMILIEDGELSDGKSAESNVNPSVVSAVSSRGWEGQWQSLKNQLR